MTTDGNNNAAAAAAVSNHSGTSSGFNYKRWGIGFAIVAIIIICISVYFFFIRPMMKKKKDEDDDSGDGGGGGVEDDPCKSAGGIKPTCTSVGGTAVPAYCDATTDPSNPVYRCQNSCDDSLKNNNDLLPCNDAFKKCTIISNADSIDATDSNNNMVIAGYSTANASEKYAWVCTCGASGTNLNPFDSAAYELCASDDGSTRGNDIVCYNDQWTCTCGGTDDPSKTGWNANDSSKCASDYGGSYVCNSNLNKWDCTCGNNSIYGFEDLCDDSSSGGGNLSLRCNMNGDNDSQQWACQCGGAFKPSQPCPSDPQGQPMMYICSRSSNTNGDNDQYEWTCVSESEACLGLQKPSCIGAYCDTSSAGAPRYVCPGNNCPASDQGKSCSGSVSNPAFNNYPLLYLEDTTSGNTDATKNHYVTRALFSVYCDAADNIQQCMTELNASKYSQYYNPDYLPNTCKINSISGVDHVCTRTVCPSIVSIPNGSSGGYSGCLNPTTLFSKKGGSASYRLSNSTGRVSPMTAFSFANNANYSNAMVLFPQPQNASSSGGLPDYTSQVSSLWVMLPHISTLNGPDASLRVRIFPIQHFHPFLMWRFAPWRNATTERPDAECNISNINPYYYIKQSLHMSDSNRTMESCNIHTFILMHYTTLTYVDTKGCHATSSDGGCACGACASGDSAEKGYVSLRRLTNTVGGGQTGFNQSSAGSGGDNTKVLGYVPFMLKGYSHLANMNVNESCPTASALGFGAKGTDYNNMLVVNPLHNSSLGSNEKADGVHPNRIPSGADPRTDKFDNFPMYLSAPFTNTNHRQMFFYFSDFYAGRELSLYHRDRASFIYMMDISSQPNLILDGNEFFKNYADNPVLPSDTSRWNREKVTIPYARFKVGTAPQISEDPSKSFVAPIQYALLNGPKLSGSPRSDSYVQFYIWDSYMTGWYATGNLQYDISSIKKAVESSSGAAVFNPILTRVTNDLKDFTGDTMDTDFAGVYKKLHWFFYSSVPSYNLPADYTSLNDYVRWQTIIHTRKYLGNWYVLQPSTDLAAYDTMGTKSKFYRVEYAATSSEPKDFSKYTYHTITPNGYAYVTVGSKKLFVCVYTGTTVNNNNYKDCLYYVDLEDPDLEETVSFYCPMISCLFMY